MGAETGFHDGIRPNEAELRSVELAALNQAVASIGSSLELPEILDQLKRQIQEHWRAPAGAIFLVEAASQALILEGAWGLPPVILADRKRFSAPDHPYRLVLSQQRALVSQDFRTVPAYALSNLAEIRPELRGYLCVPLLAKAECLGVLELFGEDPQGFSPNQVAILTTLGQQTGAMIQNSHLFTQVRYGKQRLQMLSQELLEVQERERRHIARELHDEIGQALTAVKVNLQAVMRSPETAAFPRILRESIVIIERVLQQVRDLSLDLRPSLLDDLGIVSALRWYIDRLGQRAGFRTEFYASSVNNRLPGELETVVFRVAQEALTNVVRHAIASQVIVHLRLIGGELELEVSDDGIGFDAGAVKERPLSHTSLGLIGMQERVELVNGSFEIHSSPEIGTTIRAVFPLSQA